MTDKEEQEKIKPHNVVLALYPILTKYSKKFIIEEKND